MAKQWRTSDITVATSPDSTSGQAVVVGLGGYVDEEDEEDEESTH